MVVAFGFKYLYISHLSNTAAHFGILGTKPVFGIDHVPAPCYTSNSDLTNGSYSSRLNRYV